MVSPVINMNQHMHRALLQDREKIEKLNINEVEC